MAAALSVEVEYFNNTRQEMFLDLQEGRLDLLANAVAHTMDRQVYEASQAKTGFSFSTPYIYGGLRVAGELL